MCQEEIANELLEAADDLLVEIHMRGEDTNGSRRLNRALHAYQESHEIKEKLREIEAKPMSEWTKDEMDFYSSHTDQSR